MEITTPNGTKVVLKDYITGRDSQAIQKIVHSNMHIVNGKEEASAGFIIESENKSIEIATVSVNGDTNDVLNKILDLQKTDFDFVLSEINILIKGDEEKKNELTSQIKRLTTPSKFSGKITIHPELHIFLLCKYMGWDYQTYLNQPNWMIDIASEYMRYESKNNGKQ